MKETIKIMKIGKDYRDFTCGICNEDCNPAVRYTYISTKLKDKHGNSILDGDFELCISCNKQLKKVLKDG